MVQKPWVTWIQKRLALLLVMAMTGVGMSLSSCRASHWYWETSVPETFPAVRVELPPSATDLSIELEEEGQEMPTFYLAESRTMVRKWYDSRDAKALVKLGEGEKDAARGPGGKRLISCTGSLDLQAPSGAHASCRVTGNKLDIHVEREFSRALAVGEEEPKGAAAPRVDASARPLRGGKAPKPEPVIPKEPQVERVKRAGPIELWLIPIKHMSMGNDSMVTRVRWKKVEFQGKPVFPGECDNPAAGLCMEALVALGHPVRASKYDPSTFAAGRAEAVATSIVPVLMWAMIGLNTILLAILTGLVLLWITPGDKQYLLRNVNTTVDSQYVQRGLRSFFQWCESMGPAVAFTLTVIALLLSFRDLAPGAGNDASFGNGIAMAMAATAIGLVSRLLAYTCETVLDHLVNWSSQDGIVGGGPS